MSAVPVPVPGMAAIDLELDLLEDRVAAVIDASTLTGRIRQLDHLEAALGSVRAAVADARALAITELAGMSSARRAADELGLSVAAVSKAMSRARAVID